MNWFHQLRYRVRDLARPSIILAGLLCALIIAACADRVLSHRSSIHAKDWNLDRQVGLVTHVADGDTIEVDFDDPAPPVRVRLLGVDSPELGRSSGESAKQYTSGLCGGKRVTIRLDQLQSTRDKYDRLLAYVYLPNHELLNNALVRDGQAFAYRPKKCDFSPMFEASENLARGGKRGLWKSIEIDQMPEWRQKWMKERNLK